MSAPRKVTAAEVVAAARELCRRGAEQCNVDFEASWKVHGEAYLKDAEAALKAAAQAAAATSFANGSTA